MTLVSGTIHRASSSGIFPRTCHSERSEESAVRRTVQRHSYGPRTHNHAPQ
jgi:hypothetical protein